MEIDDAVNWKMQPDADVKIRGSHVNRHVQRNQKRPGHTKQLRNLLQVYSAENPIEPCDSCFVARPNGGKPLLSFADCKMQTNWRKLSPAQRKSRVNLN